MKETQFQGFPFSPVPVKFLLPGYNKAVLLSSVLSIERTNLVKHSTAHPDVLWFDIVATGADPWLFWATLQF